MKKTSLIIISIVLLIGILGFASWKYLEKNVYSTDTFGKNTYINNINCSGLTTKEAKEKLTKAWNKKTFTFTINDKKVGQISGFDFVYPIDNELNQLKQHHFIGSAANHVFGMKFNAKVNMTVENTTKKFKKQIKDLAFLKQHNPKKTKNAYVDLSSKDFDIVPEVYGTNVDYNAVGKATLNDISTNVFTMDYVEKDFYTQPTLTANSEEILQQKEDYKEYLKLELVYKFGDKEVPITPAELGKMIIIKDKKLTTKKKAVAKYVATLAATYNTIGISRQINSLSGNSFTISGGDYGYMIDQEKEAAKLSKDIKNQKDITREPVYAQKAWENYSVDIDDSYVELSISQQKVWCYKNGKLIVETPVVTGDVTTGTITPTGVFGLTYKERNSTLRGSNVDGTTYESPVSYWMPFYGNYGLHDAPWRNAFGGSIYRGNGSHGCVNMPPAAAAKVFAAVSSQYPIIVHN
ncbi:MAG: L,D-transpeptidase family protein [Anaerovoracaceae bacterium]